VFKLIQPRPPDVLGFAQAHAHRDVPEPSIADGLFVQNLFDIVLCQWNDSAEKLSDALRFSHELSRPV
jgi:hypothetical protein